MKKPVAYMSFFYFVISKVALYTTVYRCLKMILGDLFIISHENTENLAVINFPSVIEFNTKINIKSEKCRAIQKYYFFKVKNMKI